MDERRSVSVEARGAAKDGAETTETAQGRKRTYEAIEPEADGFVSLATTEKKKKKRRKKKSKAEEKIVNFKMMDAGEASAFFRDVCIGNGALEAIEYEEAFPQIDNFVDLQNVSRSLKKLPNLVRRITPGVFRSDDRESATNGAPVLLILCSGAKRATEIIKALRKLRGLRLGKLFAKHIKLKEHIETVRNTAFPIAIGTPNRVERLLAMNALSLARTRVLLIDTFRNDKQMTVFDMRETSKDLLDVISKHVVPEVRSRKKGEASVPLRLGLF